MNNADGENQEEDIEVMQRYKSREPSSDSNADL